MPRTTKGKRWAVARREQHGRSRQLKKQREQPRGEGTRSIGADGRKPPTDGTLPSGMDPQLHSVGQTERTRDGAWSIGKTKWQEKRAAMTGTICTTRATNNSTVQDCHNKRHQHTVTSSSHISAHRASATCRSPRDSGEDALTPSA